MDDMVRRALRYSTWLPRAEDEGVVWMAWLVRLRWVAIMAQITTLASVLSLIHQPQWVVPVLIGVVVILALANIEATHAIANERTVPQGRLLGHLIVDVAALTTFFILAGGPDNSFTPLYLVHVAMAAVMLTPTRAALLVVVTLACYASLFVFHLPLHLDRHTLEPDTLKRLGQMVSMVITLVSVAGFTVGLARSLRRRKLQLLEARDRTARIDRLRSVGTLAAGAAHELNTPLSTLDLRLRRVRRRHQDDDTQADLEVMHTQLQRCSRIVNQLLVGAGDPSAAGIERKPISALVNDAVKLWQTGKTLTVTTEDRSANAVVEVPRIAFIQALINLLENAREAQEEAQATSAIEVRVLSIQDEAVVEIRDRGVGLPETPDQVGTPFYTTKPHGTGLGVFVATQVADGAGGGLNYSSAPGGGTIARWSFPVFRRTAR